MVIYVIIRRESREGGVDFSSPNFRSKYAINLSEDTEHEHIEMAFNEVKDSMETFTQNGSEWFMDNIVNLELKIGAYKLLSSTGYLLLSQILRNQKQR